MKFDIIGLTNRDKRVYEALLTMPNCSIRALAEQTGINRGSVYESIKSLSKAGLVHQVTTGKQMRYRAEDPAVLKEILQEKRQILDKSTKKLDLYVASLRQPKPESTDHPLAALYEGDEGLASILRDVLKTCRLAGVDHYRAISSPRVSRYLYNNFPHFNRERVKRRLGVRVLRQTRPIHTPADMATSRYLPEPWLDDGCYMLIYAGKVAIITLDKFNNSTGVVIDNRSVAETQARLFDVTWQGLAD